MKFKYGLAYECQKYGIKYELPNFRILYNINIDNHKKIKLVSVGYILEKTISKSETISSVVSLNNTAAYNFSKCKSKFMSFDWIKCKLKYNKAKKKMADVLQKENVTIYSETTKNKFIKYYNKLKTQQVNAMIKKENMNKEIAVF